MRYQINSTYLIWTVELVVRKVLNYNLIVTYAGENLREVLLSKLLKHEYVQTHWSTITRHIDNTVLKDTLLLKILETWIDIRANSFIKTWINAMKRKSAELYSRPSIAQKSEPALWKTLQQSRKWHLFYVTSSSFLKSTLQGFTFVEIFAKFPKIFFGSPIFSTRNSILKFENLWYVRLFSSFVQVSRFL